MTSTIKAIRDTFAKPAKRVKSEPLVLRNKLSDEEATLSTLREFRRNRVMSKPIPSQSTSVFH